MNENYSEDNVFSNFALIRNFLQLISAAKIEELPTQSIIELADILIPNIDFLTAAYEELLKKPE